LTINLYLDQECTQIVTESTAVLRDVNMKDAFLGSSQVIPLYIKNTGASSANDVDIRFECESGFWNYHNGREENIFNIYGSLDGENFDIHEYFDPGYRKQNRSIVSINIVSIAAGAVVPIWIKQENIGNKRAYAFDVEYLVSTPDLNFESTVNVSKPYISVDSSNEYNVTYHCFVDGTEIPISSFSAVKKKYGERSSLTFKPTPDVDLNLLSANAYVQMKRKYFTRDGTEQTDIILLGRIESAPIYTEGPDGVSLSVTAHYYYGDVKSSRVINVDRIIERTNDATGKIKLKVPLNNYPVVRDYIYYNNAYYRMEQFEIFVSDSVNYMEITCG